MHLKAIPTFKISDYALAKQFYIDFLKCNMDWEHRFAPDQPVYMQVSRNGLVLHLSENERFPSVAVIFVECTGLQVLYGQLRGKKTNFLTGTIETTAWGTRQLELKDPFGNLLRINENI